jgi:hypothetical protein
LTVGTVAVAMTREAAAVVWDGVIVEVMDMPMFPNALRLNAMATPMANVRTARVARLLTASPLLKDKTAVYTNPDQSTQLPPGTVHQKSSLAQTFLPSVLHPGARLPDLLRAIVFDAGAMCDLNRLQQ